MLDLGISWGLLSDVENLENIRCDFGPNYKVAAVLLQFYCNLGV